MDNVTPLVPGTNPSCVITLNPAQYACYQQSYIEFQAPNGEVLKVISESIQQELNSTEMRQLQEQAVLLQSLLGRINEQIELPPAAVAGLADLMARTKRLCERLIK